MDIKEDQQVWSVSFLRKKRIESDLNEELTQDLHKPVIIKLKRRKFYARIKDDIWVADLAKMEALIEVLNNYCV